MQEYNNSPYEFADDIGVQRPAISHIMSGRNRPSLDVVMKILKAYDQINPQWLLTGEGKMKQLDLFGETNKSDDITISESIDNQKFKEEIKRESSVGNQPVPSTATAHSQPLSNFENALESNSHTFSSGQASKVELKNHDPSSINNLKQTPVEKRYFEPNNQQTEKDFKHEISYNSEEAQTRPFIQSIPDPRYFAPSSEHQSAYRAQNYTPTSNPKADIPEEVFAVGNGGKKVEKIVILYADKSFSVYHPEWL